VPKSLEELGRVDDDILDILFGSQKVMADWK